MSDQPVFSARGLTKLYAAGEVQVHALRGEIHAGEILVLLGPSRISRIQTNEARRAG